MKVHQKSRKLMIHQGNDPTSRPAVNASLTKRVHDFNAMHTGRELGARESALVRVIERTVKGEEDLDFLKALLRSKEWYREVEACSKKSRWLKSLRKEV